MLHKGDHDVVMNKVLLAFYGDKELSPLLGFKGGTACYLFYGLPRFSVDLDFDLLENDKGEEVFKKIDQIMPEFGEVKDHRIKHFTLFWRLNYKLGRQNVKVEISRRTGSRENYEIKNFYGLSILVAKKDFMLANKLIAIFDRKRFANRDLFDAHFMLQNDWPIDEKIVKEKTGMSTGEFLDDLAGKLEKLGKINILHGLGELLEPKQKAWVKEKLLPELIFLVRIYAKKFLQEE